MSQQPKTETDRLSNVIQVLQLGQKTGRLIAERNDGSRFEQGTITFVNGQVVQANVNQQEGPEALDWLKSWGRCCFAFAPEQKSGQTNRMRSIPPQTPTPTRIEPAFGRGLTSPLRNTTGHLPFAQPEQDISRQPTGNSARLPYSQQDASRQPTGNSTRLPYSQQDASQQSINNSARLPYSQQDASRQPTGNSARLPYSQQDASQQSINNSARLPYSQQDASQQSINNSARLPYSQQNASQQPINNSARLPYSQQDASQQPINNSARLPYSQQDISHQATGNLERQRSPTAWLATPYRSRHIDDGMRLIEQMGLSRTHRRLFLLIDGRRSIKELMRLMAHEPGEILRLLQDLEGAGVIQM